MRSCRWCWLPLLAVLAAAGALQLLRGPPALAADLRGAVAVVTGASRGLGRGIAIGLGEAGATVYVTGRTLSKGQENSAGVNGRPGAGSLEETCAAVEEAGGRCVAVAADSADDDALRALFERVEREAGGVDILVNNAFSAVSWLPRHMGEAFWEKGVDAWDVVNHVGLRSHYVASTLAAAQMARSKGKKRKGVIINVSSYGGNNYIFDVAYGIGKAAMDRMANDMAIELASEGITMVSLWPGLVKTENVEAGALSTRPLAPGRGLQPGQPELNLDQLMPTPMAETPLLSGRAVAALARDDARGSKTGKVVATAVLAAEYGLSDERGVRSPSMHSLKFIASILGIHALGLDLSVPEPGQPVAISAAGKLWWNTLWDFNIPAALFKMGSGNANMY